MPNPLKRLLQKKNSTEKKMPKTDGESTEKSMNPSLKEVFFSSFYSSRWRIGATTAFMLVVLLIMAIYPSQKVETSFSVDAHGKDKEISEKDMMISTGIKTSKFLWRSQKM